MVDLSVPVPFRRLTRWDWLLLCNYLLDAYGDFLVQTTLLLFLSDNLGASDTLAPAMLAAMAVFEASIMTWPGGRMLDKWPENAPLLAVTYLKPVGAVALLLLLVTDILVMPTLGGRAAQAIALFVLLAMFAPSEVLSSLAHTLTITRICEHRDDKDNPVLRPALYYMTYAFAQVGAIFAYLTTVSFRIWAGVGSLYLANRMVLGTAVVLYVLSSMSSRAMHHALVRGGLLFPRLKTGEGGMVDHVAWRSGIDDDFDMCAWDCTARYCRKMCSAFKRRSMWGYFLLILSWIGVACEYEQIVSTLPKYMIRRFQEAIYFALFQLINPSIIFVITMILPFTGVLERIPPISLMIGGTLLLALAPAWNLVASMGKASVTTFIIQSSLGESIAQPMLSEMAMKMAPRGQESLYVSSVSAPRLAGRVIGYVMSALLLTNLCPNETICSVPASRPLDIWLTTGMIALVTPIGVTILWWRKWIE